MVFWKKKQKQRTTVKKKNNSTPAKSESKIPEREPKNSANISKEKPEKSRNEKFPKSKTIEKRPNHRKDFLNIFRKLTYQHVAWDVWRDFVIMFACSLSNPVDKTHYDEREKRYLCIIQNYNKQEQAMFPELAAHTVMALEDNPEQDFLGSIFMELNLGNESGGQFFTPYHVCQVMANITISDVIAQVEKNGYITIHDSCCGAGATLIAGVHSARKNWKR